MKVIIFIAFTCLMALSRNNQAADKYEIKLIASPLNCKLVYSTLCVALEKFVE